jgi:DNA-binding FadR family transcriptional regulator
MYSLREIVWKYILLSNQMTETLTTTIAEHEAVYNAILAHDPEAAEKALGQHLMISRAEILKVTGRLPLAPDPADN